jgi:hypothetical protein
MMAAIARRFLPDIDSSTSSAGAGVAEVSDKVGSSVAGRAACGSPSRDCYRAAAIVQ